MIEMFLSVVQEKVANQQNRLIHGSGGVEPGLPTALGHQPPHLGQGWAHLAEGWGGQALSACGWGSGGPFWGRISSWVHVVELKLLWEL